MLAYRQDPPFKKSLCGPACWLPLLLIGFLLALFAMLCGLGIICPGMPFLTAPAKIMQDSV